MSATVKPSTVKPSTDNTAPEDTNVTVTNDTDAHDTTTIKGDQVTYDATTTRNSRVHGAWTAAEDEHVRTLIAEAQQAREARENKRANHRNFNRLMTLVGAMVISFALTWLLNYYPGLPAWAHTFAPFSFAITILMDSSFTLYAFIRKY